MKGNECMLKIFEAHFSVQSIRARNTAIPSKNNLLFAFHC